MLWAGAESAPNNARNRTTSTLVDTMHHSPILSEHGFGLQAPIRLCRGREKRQLLINELTAEVESAKRWPVRLNHAQPQSVIDSVCGSSCSNYCMEGKSS